MKAAIAPIPFPQLIYCETMRRHSADWFAAIINNKWRLFASEDQVERYCQDHGFRPVRDDRIHPAYPNNRQSCVISLVDDEDELM